MNRRPAVGGFAGSRRGRVNMSLWDRVAPPGRHSADTDRRGLGVCGHPPSISGQSRCYRNYFYRSRACILKKRR